MVHRLGLARSTSAMCRMTVRAMKDLVGAGRIGLFLAQGAPPKFKLEVLTGAERPAGHVGFELGQGRLGHLAELIGVRSSEDVGAAWSAANKSTADPLFRPDLCVAIRQHDKVFAFVALDDVERSDPQTRRQLQMLADLHAASAAGLPSLHKERLKSEIDMLTGLFNRRHLTRRLADEMIRAQIFGCKLSIFLFGLDNYPALVEAHGEEATDRCLQHVAAVAHRQSRGDDVVGRYSGDEFLVILLGADATAALRYADRIRRAIIRAEPIGQITISGGVACYPDDAAHPDELIEWADQAFYEAMENGFGGQVFPASQVRGSSSQPPLGQGLPIESEPPLFAPRSVVQALISPEKSGLRGSEPVHTPLPRPVIRVQPQHHDEVSVPEVLARARPVSSNSAAVPKVQLATTPRLHQALLEQTGNETVYLISRPKPDRTDES